MRGTVRGIRETEVDAWCACPRSPGDPDFEEWRDAERAWVNRHHEGTRNLFVCEAGGTLLGKYDVPFEERGRWTLWAPTVRDTGAGAMHDLCQHILSEARRRGIAEVEVILESSHAHAELAQAALARAGLSLAEEKILVSRDLAVPLPAFDLDCVRARDLSTEVFAELCRAAGADPLHQDDPLCLVAAREGALLGVAVPGREGPEFTLEYLGIIPAARGHGHGFALLIAALTAARDAGYRLYVGSTESRNTAMRRVFDRAGCTELGERFVFNWKA